ncbi:MAG: metallophosphoesterase, partial [Lentisphaeria bacterium]|nr:metallophosphoesterase [Lentisphaeria bacterium]
MKIFSRMAFLFAALFALSICTAQDSYRIVFLGDTHYDAEDVKLHPEGISKAYPRDIEMWKERLPKLLTAANQKAAESNTAFVLQAGDMVEGGSGTADAHKNMLEAGTEKLQSYFSVPVLTTCGNHDISTKIRKGEPYPAQIYEKFLQQNVLPALNKTEGIKV